MRRSQATAIGLALLAAIFIVRAASAVENASNVQSLAGEWSIRLDPGKCGLKEKWFAESLPPGAADQFGKGRLPGSTDENKLGQPNNRPANFDWLSRLVEYCGPAWYQREIEIPEAWKGKRVSLFLERCHWETQVWLDDRFCGMADSMATAHVHEIGSDLAPGKHRLTLRVDNAIKFNLGPHAHSTSEHTQTNWNGVVGRIELLATDFVWIEDVQVYPNLGKKTVRVAVKVGNATGRSLDASIDVAAVLPGPNATKPRVASTKSQLKANESTTLEITLPMGDDVRPWDEFSPSLYELTASLSCNGYNDRRQVRFGMRKLAVEDKRLVLNGRKVFLRGTLDCCIYPLTGYPPTDLDSWLRVLRICRSYGLNHIRFHSWCPPEAAFDAADRMGFILQAEVPTWIDNWGKDIKRDQYVEVELKRMLDAYGNHPSFGLLTMGNEPSGDMAVLHRLVRIAKEHDRRHLYAAASGWGGGPDDDYCVTPNGRGVRGPATTHDMRGDFATWTKPVISHEVGQWTFYPNMEEIKKYTGVLRPRNFERIRDDLTKKGLLSQSGDFLRASGLWSVQLYKEEIEIMLRTPAHGGFQLLDLHDFPGQGTALIGLLDPFWDSKGLIAPEAFRRFCAQTVPLARLAKRTYDVAEPFKAQIDVAHYGPTVLTDAKATWTIKDSVGSEVASGKFAPKTLPTGELTTIGVVEASLAKAAAPARLTLVVSLDGTTIANDWNFWVYPTQVNAAPGDVVISADWDDATRAALAEGKRVLLTPRGSAFASRKSIQPLFTTVFWSPVWFAEHGGGTMGILCDPKHPALAKFPTDMHTNWQWNEPIANSKAMILDSMPGEIRPIVQMVDNFRRNRRLGLVFEARVGKGRLLVSSIDLIKNIEKRPVSRQLLASLLAYMQSDAFQPKVELDENALTQWISLPRSGVLKKLGAKVIRVDSESPDHKGGNALDGDPDTIWHTSWGDGETSFPHEMQIDLQKASKLNGLTYLPRQDMANGRIAAYEIYVSDDGKQWGEPVAQGNFPNTGDLQTVLFKQPRAARFIRFVALKEVNGNKFASIAELDVIVEK